MKFNIAYSLILTCLLLHSCKNSQQGNPYATNEITPPSQQDLAEGFHSIENNCISCHSLNPAVENNIAPTMAAIKSAYLKGNSTRAQFTEDYIAFLNNPGTATSKMPEAIKRFNLMPKMSLSDDQISKIAAYIYTTDLEKPEWFENNYAQEKQKYHSILNLSPIDIGQEIALKTKGILGKNLLEALNTKGTEGALAFCSTRAIPLTDSMALALNAKIKRVSDNNRNPDNKANEAELAYINATKERIAKGEKPTPQLTTRESKLIGYYPIMSNQMCLQCHGKAGTEISQSTLSKIDSLYPNDLATGYGSDELRGIWVIEMDKN